MFGMEHWRCDFSRTLYLPLLTNFSSPATARNVYVRAERHNIDAALWGMT
ncbi:MAG: hypothetical protein K2N54_05135 [Helicobacter sp.]|nr:hypothetical protein [Helicobacter sp.]